jgi:hypothetical protein
VVYRLCEGIWAGSYPDEQTIRKLTKYGVKTYVNLTRDDEKLWYGRRSYCRFLPNRSTLSRFPLWSYDLPPVNKLLHTSEILESGNPSYLHCRQGLDRTGAVAMLTLMKRGMSLNEAQAHLNKAREGLSDPSPRKKYHFRYLRNAEACLHGNACLVEKDKPASEQVVVAVAELAVAMRKQIERIIVKGYLAQPVHRALSALNALVEASVQMIGLDLGNAAKLALILAKYQVGPKKINAVLTQLGPKLSYELTRDYREISYLEPDGKLGEHHGQCVLELKE